MGTGIYKEIVLNEELLKKQGVNNTGRAAIMRLHEVLLDVLENPVSFHSREFVVEFIENIEFALQSIWGFDPNKNFHTHWNKVKGCKCPHGDNEMLFGLDMRWINHTCPFHGKPVGGEGELVKVHNTFQETPMWAWQDEDGGWTVGSNQHNHRENTAKAGYKIGEVFIKPVDS